MIEKGFEKVLDEALKLHKAKNSDYNGSQPLYKLIGIRGRFSDIWRKTIRLYSLVWEGNKREVSKETIRDTAVDLLVYTALFITTLDDAENKKHQGEKETIEITDRFFENSFEDGPNYELDNE